MFTFSFIHDLFTARVYFRRATLSLALLTNGPLCRLFRSDIYQRALLAPIYVRAQKFTQRRINLGVRNEMFCIFV